MISAFCPAHITCFFQPVDVPDTMRKGSRGSGIRLDKGATVAVSENRSGHTDVVMDNVSSEAPITRRVLDLALPGRGFDVMVSNGLSTGQGFGMSAAGAIAVALCAKEISGFSEQEAYMYAHRAEVEFGGGLGDVSGIMGNVRQPVRIRPGLPPMGEVIGTDVDPGEMSVVIIGPKICTSDVLGDSEKYRSLCEAGRSAVDTYLVEPSLSKLYSISNYFSKKVGLESDEMQNAMNKLGDFGIMSGMCMLGNSIFVNGSAGIVSRILGVNAISTHATDAPAKIIRKG